MLSFDGCEIAKMAIFAPDRPIFVQILGIFERVIFDGNA